MNVIYFLFLDLPHLQPATTGLCDSLSPWCSGSPTFSPRGFSSPFSGGRDVDGWSWEMKGRIVYLSSCTLATWRRCFCWVETHNGHLRPTWSFISWGSGWRRTGGGPEDLLKCDPERRSVNPEHRERKWLQGKAQSAEINSRESMLIFRNSII